MGVSPRPVPVQTARGDGQSSRLSGIMLTCHSRHTAFPSWRSAQSPSCREWLSPTPRSCCQAPCRLSSSRASLQQQQRRCLRCEAGRGCGGTARVVWAHTSSLDVPSRTCTRTPIHPACAWEMEMQRSPVEAVRLAGRRTAVNVGRQRERRGGGRVSARASEPMAAASAAVQPDSAHLFESWYSTLAEQLESAYAPVTPMSIEREFW